MLALCHVRYLSWLPLTRNLANSPPKEPPIAREADDSLFLAPSRPPRHSLRICSGLAAACCTRAPECHPLSIFYFFITGKRRQPGGRPPPERVASVACRRRQRRAAIRPSCLPAGRSEYNNCFEFFRTKEQSLSRRVSASVSVFGESDKRRGATSWRSMATCGPLFGLVSTSRSRRKTMRLFYRVNAPGGGRCSARNAPRCCSGRALLLSRAKIEGRNSGAEKWT